MAGLLVGLSLLILTAYLVFRGQLYDQLDAELRVMGQAVTFSVEHGSQGPEFNESIYLANRRDALQLGPHAAAQWLDLNGRVLHSQGGLQVVPRPPRDGEVHSQNSPAARVYTRLGTYEDHPFGYGRVALGLEPLHHELRKLARRLAVIGLLALLATGAASWWWTGRVLEPIRCAYEELSTFSGAVAHELRTPLAALRLNAEGTLKHFDRLSSEQVRDALRELDQVSEEMGKTVNALMLLAQVRGGHGVTDCKPLHLDQVASEMVCDAQPVAQSRKLELTWNPPPEPLLVSAVDEYLRIVLRNLIDNALHYTEPGGRVEVSCSHQGGRVQLQVRDTGGGLTPAEVASIFEAFWRADHSRARHLGGAGLGLAIVSALVKVQGATIKVDSHVGSGSCFTVEFACTA